MPSLDRAVALEEVDERAVLVTENLNLHVPGSLDGPLDVDRRVSEGGAGAPLGAAKAASMRSGPRTSAMPIPPPPAAAFSMTG